MDRVFFYEKCKDPRHQPQIRNSQKTQIDLLITTITSARSGEEEQNILEVKLSLCVIPVTDTVISFLSRMKGHKLSNI